MTDQTAHVSPATAELVQSMLESQRAMHTSLMTTHGAMVRYTGIVVFCTLVNAALAVWQLLGHPR